MVILSRTRLLLKPFMTSEAIGGVRITERERCGICLKSLVDAAPAMAFLAFVLVGNCNRYSEQVGSGSSGQGCLLAYVMQGTLGKSTPCSLTLTCKRRH